MPAEWEPHAATWIAWPHHEPDWPGKLDAVRWDYAEIVRALHRYEPVEIICNDDAVRESALDHLQAHHVDAGRYRLHDVPTDRVWLRDSAPTGVLRSDGTVEWMNWGFNAWAKYDNYSRDALVGEAIARITGHRLENPTRAGGGRLILEGGGIEVDGAGTLLVTEEWLLTDVQVRNPDLTRADYERLFAEYLGISRTIWLGEGAVGDDTHGHVDDIARFAPGGTVLLAFEEDPADANHQRSADNLRRLELASLADPFNIVLLPFPRPVIMRGERLPASYANFYVCNSAVLVPTFNDQADREALEIVAAAFADREVIGIHAVNLVWGLGTLHCLTQQQPAPV
ncbi:MAG TPA: agmatine deiminase family protein [Gemmatimonadaceae bacterium]|nr:agmatine deiminase family protein [Gemmatimonadaceae bacterium]